MSEHKGADKLRADLRKRIAKRKSDAQQKKGSAKGVTAYSIEREGAAQVNKDFIARLKFAKVWGRSAFGGQMVQRYYVLPDGDIVEIHI